MGACRSRHEETARAHPLHFFFIWPAFLLPMGAMAGAGNSDHWEALGREVSELEGASVRKGFLEQSPHTNSGPAASGPLWERGNKRHLV